MGVAVTLRRSGGRHTPYSDRTPLNLLDQLYLHTLTEWGPGDDIAELWFLAEYVNTYTRGWTLLSDEGLVNVKQDMDPEVGEWFTMVSMTEAGLKLAQERNTTEVGQAVVAEAKVEAAVKAAAADYVGNPKWGIL